MSFARVLGIGNIVFDTRMGCLDPCMPSRVQQFINAIEMMMSTSLKTAVGTEFFHKHNLQYWKNQSESWDKIFEISTYYTRIRAIHLCIYLRIDKVININ